MANETASLVLKVESDQVGTADKRLTNFTRSAGAAETATSGLVSMFGKLVTAAAALEAFRRTATTIGEFEATMSSVSAVLGTTSEELKSLSDEARRMGASTRFSATEAAQGIKLLGQAGFNTNQIIAAMPGMLNLAIAGELGLAQASDVASATLAGFQMNAAEAGRVADVFATAANASNSSVADLGEGMKYVAPIAASMKLSLEEVTAAMGILSNNGIKGSMAGTGLRQVLSSLASPTREAAETLRAYGLKIDDVNPSTHKLTEVIATLSKASLTASDAFTIFGDRGAPALLALTSQSGQLNQLNDTMVKSKGRAAEMSQVMNDNLKGDFLNLQSAVEELMLKMGDAGLLNSLRSATQGLIEFVNAINDMVASGEAAAWVDVFMGKLDLLTDGFYNAFENITILVSDATHYWATDGKEAAETITDAFKDMPENIRAVMQGIGAMLGDGVNKWVEIFRYDFTLIGGLWTWLVDVAKASLSGINQALHGEIRGGWDTFTKGIADAGKKLEETNGKAFAQLEARYDDSTAAFEETVTAIMNERDANIAATDAKIKHIEELRASYQKLKADKKAAEEEKASKPVAGPVGRGGMQPPSQERFDTLGFQQLRDQLRSEEDAVQESYLKRLELIRKNTTEGSDLRIQLERELNERLVTETFQATQAHAERLDLEYQATQSSLQNALDKKLITEREYQQKSQTAWNDYTKKLVSLGTQGTSIVTQKQLEMYSNVLNISAGISQQMSELVGQNNAAAKAMFIATKAIAIAQAVVNTEVAATRALAEGGFIAGIPMATIIRSLGYASVGLIAAQAITAFEHGGMVPAGKLGLVGEAGAEVIKGPAIVSSARTTADMGNRGGAPIVPVSIYVNNQMPDAEISAQATPQSDGSVVINMLVKRVEKALAGKVMSGGSALPDSMERAYGLRRASA